jgi:hypothetical protein
MPEGSILGPVPALEDEEERAGALGPRELSGGDEARPFEGAPDNVEGPVVYRLALPTVAGLRGFADNALSARGIFIRTVNARPPGTMAVVCVVHPQSRDEFHLPGEVIAVGTDEQGVAVAFHGVTPNTAEDFRRFIVQGSPNASPLPAPHPGADRDEADAQMTLVHVAARTRRGDPDSSPLENAQDIGPSGLLLLTGGGGDGPVSSGESEDPSEEFEELSVADLFFLDEDETL